MKDGITYGATIGKYSGGFVHGVDNSYQCIRSIVARPSSQNGQHNYLKHEKENGIKVPDLRSNDAEKNYYTLLEQ
jgi:hypothetical protein